MRTTLSTLIVTLSLAAAPTLALAGPTDTTGSTASASSIPTEGTAIVAVIPTASLPICSGDTCAAQGAVTFTPVITDYPPSPCSPDGSCTSITVTVPTQQ